MGCTASKLDNEDTVRRCKERRRLMKDAVFARHHLAAAHSDYCRSLRVTGSALSDFAAGEPFLIVSPSTPSVLLHPPAAPKTKSPPSLSSSHAPPPPPIRVHAPPPPPPSSIHEHSPTISSSNLPHILSASSVPSSGRKNKKLLKHPPPPSMKLPHILSDSSVASTPTTARAPPNAFEYHATYASTPSQASSVWNWENFYPPSPPGSDFFAQKPEPEPLYNPPHHLGADEERERESEREEVHCSEWGDHYSTTTTSDSDDHNDDEADDERETRSEISSVRSEPMGRPGPIRTTTSSRMGKLEERSEEDGGESCSSSMRWKDRKSSSTSNGGKELCGGEEDMRIVVRHKDLKEIVSSIKDYFDMAASAGDQVSEMLETGRAQLDRSFSQLKSKITF